MGGLPTSCFSCHWYFSYAAASQILVPIMSQDADLQGQDLTRQVSASPVALLFLAIGLFIQASIATWALATTRVPAWSSNPFDVLKACELAGYIRGRQGRFMKMNVAERSQSSAPKTPRHRQPSQFQSGRRACTIVSYIWITVALALLWGALAYHYAEDYGRGTN